MTVSDYISRTRIKLSDNVSPYRFGDAEVQNALTASLYKAYQVRPSLRYENGALVTDETEVNFSGSISKKVRTELDRYAEGLILLSASQILANDNSDTSNSNVSEKWRGQALELLVI